MKALGLMPRRLKRQVGRHALVDGIPFALPVRSFRMQALMAAFPVDTERARGLLPPSMAPARLWNRTLLVVTVVNYQETSIGKYIEYSVALTAARRDSDPPRLLPLVLPGPFRFGQYVLELPVSSEVSVKGGKGIWGMPKHQANLDFVVEDGRVSSQYDKDGKAGVFVDIQRPRGRRLPVAMGASNYCSFRGMLMKSDVYFRGRAEVGLPGRARGAVRFGDLERVEPLKSLDVGDRPLFTVFFPEAHGVLDDYVESWFLPYGDAPADRPEGLESVVELGLGEEWLPAAEPRVMDDWQIVVTMVLFACASIYLGTGWSLALFTIPGRSGWTVDNYYDQLMAPIARATRFFTGMTIVMLACAVALVVAEWGSAYVLAPIAVLVAVVAATVLTTLVIFRYNRRLRERVTDPAELHDLLERWVRWNWLRLALWTAQWVAAAVYVGLKLR